MSNEFLPSIQDRALKTKALEAAYAGGYTGCILPDPSTPEGRKALKEQERFRDLVGKNQYRAEDSLTMYDNRGDDEMEPYQGVEGCYVFTAYSFEEFEKYNEGYNNWIYQMLQNSGNCVGASGAEMMMNLLGVQSRDPTNEYQMFTLASLWAYSYRGSCGSGWYMSAHASVAREHGWCPATIFDGRALGTKLTTPSYQDLEFHTESQCERYPSSVWCRGGPPDAIENWVHSNFRYDDGAIVEVTGTSDEMYKGLARRGASLHHGSNTTAGSGGLDTTRGIGGHAQTCYGQDWSDECISWFKSKGVNSISKSNHAMLHGQTWGGGWSGEISDSNWPFGSLSDGTVITWADVKAIRSPNEMFDLMHAVKGNWGWGPKNQGAWMTTVSTYNRYLDSYDYAYFPKFQGVPGEIIPPPPPPYRPVNGYIYGSIGSGLQIVLSGTVYHIDSDGTRCDHVVASDPTNPGSYKFVSAANCAPLNGTIKGEVADERIVIRGRPYHIDSDGSRYDHILVPVPGQPGTFKFEKGTVI